MAEYATSSAPAPAPAPAPAAPMEAAAAPMAAAVAAPMPMPTAPMSMPAASAGGAGDSVGAAGGAASWRRVDVGGHGGSVGAVALAWPAGATHWTLCTGADDGCLRLFTGDATGAAPALVTCTPCFERRAITALAAAPPSADGRRRFVAASTNGKLAVVTLPPVASDDGCPSAATAASVATVALGTEEVASVALAPAASDPPSHALALAVDDNGDAYVVDASGASSRALHVARRVHDVLGSAAALKGVGPTGGSGPTHMAVTGGFDQRLVLWHLRVATAPYHGGGGGDDDSDDAPVSILAASARGKGRRTPKSAPPPPPSAAAAAAAPDAARVASAVDAMTQALLWNASDVQGAPPPVEAGGAKKRGKGRAGRGGECVTPGTLLPPPHAPAPATDAAAGADDGAGSDGKILNPAFVHAVAWHPAAGAATFAAAFGDGSVAVYDGATGRRLWRAPAHGRAATCVAYAPDGSALVTAGDDGRVAVWPLAATGAVAVAALPPPPPAGTPPPPYTAPAACVPHGRGPNAVAVATDAAGALVIAVADVTRRVAVYLQVRSP